MPKLALVEADGPLVAEPEKLAPVAIKSWANADAPEWAEYVSRAADATSAAHRTALRATTRPSHD